MVATEKGASCFVLVMRHETVMPWFTVVAVFSRIVEIHDEQWKWKAIGMFSVRYCSDDLLSLSFVQSFSTSWI